MGAAAGTIDIEKWIHDFSEGLVSLFGNRVAFFGLQGSYSRGEASAGSDIDVVVILDMVSPKDLIDYGTFLNTLSHRELVCGFVSGMGELLCWDRSELFQFYFDTTPIIGDLDFLRPLIKESDIRHAVHVGACGIYHSCSHNYLHERSPELLSSLYKSASFVLRAKHFLDTGQFVSKKSDLIPLLSKEDKEIFEESKDAIVQERLDELSFRMLEWSSDLICRYGDV